MGIGSSKNVGDEADRVLLAGQPNYEQCDNMITTSKYTLWNFLPLAIGGQFRRFANMYFLIVGIIMYIGAKTTLWETAVPPYSTLGPLAIVISVSLWVEGSSDAKRHRSDSETNNAPCIILRRSEEMDADESAERDKEVLGGKDVVVNLTKAYFQTSNSKQEPETPVAESKSEVVKIGFEKVKRMNIRQGHFILVKNREMVPADMILLASSGDSGSAYIETSSIDGETNLKLRTSPHLPKNVLKFLRDGTPMDSIDESPEEEGPGAIETLEQATKRISRFSTLAYPNGTSALENPSYDNGGEQEERDSDKRKFFPKLDSMKNKRLRGENGQTQYVAALTSEPPNPHVNTFSGKLTLPPVEDGGKCHDIPLGAENILLRGAVVRNTEWVIGLSCFTGTDTKLVQNSFETPSKFSQLDVLMNKTVVAVITIMILVISYLATQAVIANDDNFDNIWYVGLNTDENTTWPYLPEDFEPPAWQTGSPNWFQMFFLYVTLMSNFIPLSMYVTVELINFFFLYLIYVDVEMYDAVTNTRAVARSTNVTDLGQIQYIFSDKTGTLTQNVMRFKRCSVDGMMFGTPIQKTRPGAEDEGVPQSSFHPTRHILTGRIPIKDKPGPSANLQPSSDGKLTFNSEMFLRVMSLCHTVVVEKDLDLKPSIDASKSASAPSPKKNTKKSFFGSYAGDALEVVVEEGEKSGGVEETENNTNVATSMEKSSDGAPIGFAYQAESPDEGALVSAASKLFGFQVIGRDSSGIKLRCAHPTIFSDDTLVEGIKSGKKDPKALAVESASGVEPIDVNRAQMDELLNDPSMQREETWSILAVNKFDSERKRMSILLRSPPELGNVAMLLCKGADSAMLDPDVCTGGSNIMPSNSDDGPNALDAVAENEEEEWEMAQMLGIQSHLGEFASEGLRTLVLGIRFLAEDECESWLETYRTAATSIKNRDQMLKEAAFEIERNLHIVGATAIEDKLQTDVPKTIATLGKAGIKLWVLTGDKRETAIEIGYSTNVLTPRMHLTEVADKGCDHVRAQCAMEFMRLVKAGKLPMYQRAAVDQPDEGWTWANFFFAMGKCRRSLSRSVREFFIKVQVMLGKLLGVDAAVLDEKVEAIKKEEEAEQELLKDVVRRRNVRNRAEKIIQDFLNSPEGEPYRRKDSPKSDASGEISLSSDDVPAVFNRAQSARSMLGKRKSEGMLTSSELRTVSLAQLTAQQLEGDQDLPIIDEDTLSLKSFLPTSGDVTASDFDKRRRTTLERLFAVDRDVRKGRLFKHLKKEKRIEALSSPTNEAIVPTGDGPRGLVIEGAALKHLLGDSELEEVIFSLASQSDSVIACRVSPRQKALLVKLVRKNVVPEPVTLAIGDGANDVGMIQEAHVGIGISGKEGKQAVNASDFAIAQFRFLEELVLIHGRWNFFRLSTVVMFSFYKNVVMAGNLIVFTGETLYSGTPLFDAYILAMLNFLAAVPITFFGLFDRCLEKDYILRKPEVYQPTRQNELITFRVFLRWVLMTVVHILVIYYGTVPPLSSGGGMTSAFSGLMRNADPTLPGDGEGGDLQSVGTVTFSVMIFLLAYKVLYESKSLIHGRWPAITCGRSKEGFFSRLPYTWLGVTYFSLIFYILFLWVYSIISRLRGPGEFFQMVGVTPHILGTRSITYLVLLFVPIAAIGVDASGKLFSNMFYPTQTQIHIEMEAKEIVEKRKRDRSAPPVQMETPMSVEASV